MQSRIAGIVAAAWIGLTTSPGAAETISFRFAPPDGTNYVQTLVTVRERDLEGMQKQVDRSEAQTAFSIKHDGAGYRIAATPMSLRLTRNDQVVQDPVSSLLQGMVVTYVIDRDGHLKELRGYETLAEKMQATLPPEIAKALAPLLNEKTLVARETAEYNGRIGDFAGKEFTVGESTDSEVLYGLPNGKSLKYYMRTTVKGLEACPPGRCARIEVSYNSDASALGKSVVDATAGLVKAAPGGDAALPTSVSSKVSGSASRLIDPNTMLLYGEKLSRSVSMLLDVPGKGEVPSHLSETREYTFSYH